MPDVPCIRAVLKGELPGAGTVRVRSTEGSVSRASSTFALPKPESLAMNCMLGQ